MAEHISYLALPGRYELFSKAFETIIQPGDTVADLGCGVGVLGLQCLKAGASKVYGIDGSKAIDIAGEAMTRAELTDKYHCIAGSTFDVSLPERVDALICDHIGFFGIDYGIVDMLRDAEKRFLKPSGVIVPDGIKLLIAGVSSEKAQKKAAAWTGEQIPAEFHWLDEQSRNTKHSYNFGEDELCSAETELGYVALGAEAEEMCSFFADLIIDRDCVFGGIAGWFSAHLGGDVWMTNSPLDTASIKREQALFPVSRPFAVRAGDRIEVAFKVRSDGELLIWKVRLPDGSIQKQSTWASMALSLDDLKVAGNEPVELSEKAADRQFVLSHIDGVRTAAEIEEIVLGERPDLRPTIGAGREFVRTVLARNSKA
ncbi:50S ribosomal protein L11 methyltransferase [Erythrobacter sp. MTPC3]|uniref:50S ribosomal protein L11 methyltransferase n=1 Tax=Erythrobacter sp. MTPC3 TaxID=3056564 RepID=UPI0036F3FFB9